MPILLLAYSREDFVGNRLTEISDIKPESLIISIDRHEDRAITRSIQERIHNFSKQQKQIKVKVICRNSKIGLARHLPMALDEVFEDHDQVFVVEDDISISRASYASVASQINHADLSSRIFSVGGFSPLSLPWNCQLNNSWRRTKYFSGWGWAIRKEVWRNSIPIISSKFDRQLENSSSFNSLMPNQKYVWRARFEKCLKYPERTWDIPLQFASFVLDYSHILPKFRIIDNLGFADKRAENTSTRRPKWMLREFSYHKKILSQNINEHRYLEILDAYAIGGDISKSETLNLLKKALVGK